jgi:hypothetical protein
MDNPEIGIRSAPDAIFSSQTSPGFEPSTPLSLAISAILALIPHPDDPNPTESESVHLRRVQAQALAQSAYEGIEIESELPASITSPKEALSSESHPLTRNKFHSRMPLETESIVALLLLSTYEYAQRGNIARMRNRAGQALNAAIDLGLHCKGDEEGYYAESNRRVWWMTYTTVCQASIVSNTVGRPVFQGLHRSWAKRVTAASHLTLRSSFHYHMPYIGFRSRRKSCNPQFTYVDVC